jgi:hypothetical protein
MALPLIRLNPTMTFDELVAALNENFALSENVNRTQVFKDETGTNRIILGRQPDGTYGLVISKVGTDVIKLYQS